MSVNYDHLLGPYFTYAEKRIKFMYLHTSYFKVSLTAEGQGSETEIMSSDQQKMEVSTKRREYKLTRT